MKIVRDGNLCRGCRTCELACSFHHKRVFSPKLSSIRISNNYWAGAIHWSVNPSCDFCKDEAKPLCIQYCPYKALKQVR